MPPCTPVTAFVALPHALSRELPYTSDRVELVQSRHVPVCRQQAPSTKTAQPIDRRKALQAVAGATAAVMLGVVPPGVGPAHADRTGKYSTKLTAKRRYLPRIERDMAAFAALGAVIASGSAGWEGAVAEFLRREADDAKSAMPLFSTTFFSEGNKIGPTERRLKQIEDDLFDAWEALGRAAGTGRLEQATSAYFAGVECANDYVVIAKLTEVVPLIAK